MFLNLSCGWGFLGLVYTGKTKRKAFSALWIQKNPLLTAGDLQLKVPQYGVRVEWANGHTRAIIQIFMITIFSMIVRQVWHLHPLPFLPEPTFLLFCSWALVCAHSLTKACSSPRQHHSHTLSLCLPRTQASQDLLVSHFKTYINLII